MRTRVKPEALAAEIEVLREALDESVRLQAHYANLLNMHDGGRRLVFKTTEEWLARLEKIRHDRKFPTLAVRRQ